MRAAPVILALASALAACVPPDGPRYSPPSERAQSQTAVRERWQPQDVVTNARPVDESSYEVRPGDSLSVIAERSGASISAIAAANGLAPPYTIFPGQELRIPGGRYHRVNRGETGIAIALAYGVDWDRIVAANGLEPPFLLRVGQRLRLPGSGPASPAQPGRTEQTEAGREHIRMAAFDIDIDDIISGGEPAGTADTVRPREIVPFDGRFSWPAKGRLVSGYGAKAGGLYNDGINIAASAGDPVRAAASGTVIYAGNGVEGWGNLILIKHDDSWVSAYAHNQAFYVERGDRVNLGERIADVGQSGSVDSPQLHFELRQGRRPVDPQRYLPAG
ncbi:hypothetical protein B5C34_04525 [Pacificimonas flava]|uniref:LysM domain-containing protein n=2 Tax=Pacificimonas TaxID=1960290 RepID=A0A219B4S6_9SPHN|nr:MULTISPECIES: M23 family metallopeptidase [Pacificimonas]MBZ6377517.1 M23 family metallopeptidase [Pacificimonas aurantium]OWV32789.1 hypothetical protein B5C34_04525 [Pacificimonas flava]